MTDAPAGRCRHLRETGAGFVLRSEEQETLSCWHCAVRHRPMLRRSVKIAVLVGTILSVINQGDVLLQGGVTTTIVGKIVLTYFVPFFVASWGALAQSRIGPADIHRCRR